jgi:glycine/D-amino acid oxidase-like deaminating enzyme
VIVGGGFYGAAIAIYLIQQHGFKRIVLVERESGLLKRASYHNQARVHNGYHYPRSFTTAFRSRVNLPRFLQNWPEVVKTDFAKLYAIARNNSKVTAKQFERFCHEIGAKIQAATSTQAALFNPRLIEAVYQVEEYAFDSSILAKMMGDELARCHVQVRLNTRVTHIEKNAQGRFCVRVSDKDGDEEILTSRYVFNCTYSGLNQIGGDFPGVQSGLKQEVTEMALVQMPPALQDIGITVMDGPFFSTMPFPARKLHTLSHVRYTPHMHWQDKVGVDPYDKLAQYERDTRVDRMMRDVSRYLPAISNADYVDSLFEVKTVLTKNETDDGRPILFEKHTTMPGCYSILGGKIDNIYDVMEKLDGEQFDVGTEQAGIVGSI